MSRKKKDEGTSPVYDPNAPFDKKDYILDKKPVRRSEQHDNSDELHFNTKSHTVQAVIKLPKYENNYKHWHEQVIVPLLENAIYNIEVLSDVEKKARYYIELTRMMVQYKPPEGPSSLIMQIGTENGGFTQRNPFENYLKRRETEIIDIPQEDK